MRINEVITEHKESTDEAVYPGMMWLTEFLDFMDKAEKTNPELAMYVYELIEHDRPKEAIKYIAEFLGIKEGVNELSEVDDRAARILQLRKDFQKLQMSPGMGGKDMAEIMKARKAKLKAQIADIQAGKDVKTAAPAAQQPARRPDRRPVGKPVRKRPFGQNADGSFNVEGVKETATAGATSAGNIASVANPHISPGKDKNKAAGSPGKMGKSPAQPKPKKQKPTDNALDMKNTSLFGGAAVKR